MGMGDPALMIHCSLAQHQSLLRLAGHVGGAVTLFDMPGHGRSGDWDGVQDYQELTADIAATLAPQPAHIIGHSFGATVALRLAITHPEKVSHLTLIEPVFFAAAAGAPEHVANAEASRAFTDALAQGDRVTATRLFLRLWGTGQAWDDTPQVVRDYAVARIHLVVAGGAAIEADNAGLRARLGDIACPVTLIEGAKSPAVIGAIQSALAAAIPQVKRVIIDGAGHMVPVTHAAEVAAAL